MGAGLYLVWPAFYTDVTDSYRLGRAGRLRTDLGGPDPLPGRQQPSTGLDLTALLANVLAGPHRARKLDAITFIAAGVFDRHDRIGTGWNHRSGHDLDRLASR